MRVAIISDTHDNIWTLAAARSHLAGADALIHCGDLCSPFMISRLVEIMGEKPVHVVWGNNDGDRRMITLLALKAGTVHLHGDFAALELGGLRVAVTHYPLVCYGHDHTAHHERVGETDLLNPGELMGLYGRTTLALYDTESREVQFEEVRA